MATTVYYYGRGIFGHWLARSLARIHGLLKPKVKPEHHHWSELRGLDENSLNELGLHPSPFERLDRPFRIE